MTILEIISTQAIAFPDDERRQWLAMHAFKKAANLAKNKKIKEFYRKRQRFFGKRAVILADKAIAKYVAQGERW